MNEMKIRPLLGAIKRVLKYKIKKEPISELMHVYGTPDDIKVVYKVIQNSRQESTEKMIRSVVEKWDQKKHFDFYIWTGDKAERAELFRKALRKKYIFAYSTENKFPRVIAIPDFVYIGWKEAGIASWETIVDDCVSRGKTKWDDNRMFWIGNTKTHVTREQLVRMSEENTKLMLCEGMSWLDNRVGEKQKSTKYVSLPEHANYKYLIDIQGIGYSGRLKLLFYLQRPVFIAERRHKDFFFDGLKDLYNCVYVKEDLSDLIEKIKYIENNPELYNKIVDGQNELCKTILDKEKALLYLNEALEKYAF